MNYFLVNLLNFQSESSYSCFQNQFQNFRGISSYPLYALRGQCQATVGPAGQPHQPHQGAGGELVVGDCQSLEGAVGGEEFWEWFCDFASS